jgi:hypothetical protein
MTAWKDVDKDTFLKNKEAADARKTGGGSWDSWKPTASKAGVTAAKNVIRIMPPHQNMNDVFVEARIHFLPSKEIDQKTKRPIPIGINCLAQYGKDCGACNMVDRLYKSAKGEDDADTAKRIKSEAYDKSAKTRLFANIVDIQHPEKAVQKYAFGPEVEKKLRACFLDDEGEFRNISHPKNGRDVIMMVTKKPGEGDFNEYVQVKAKDTPSPIADMEWLDGINDLSEMAKEPTVADMELALKGERPKTDGKVAEKKTEAAPAAAEKKAEKAAAPAAEKKAEAAAPAKSKRQPVTEDNGDQVWANARAAITKAGLDFTPVEITPEELEKVKKPACFTKETDISDSACQTCRVLIPCLEAKMMAEAA